MAKDIVVGVEKYTKDGQEKTKYLKIGVILSNANGEYALLDPTVNLAGVMLKQRLMNPQKAGSSVIASIFDNDNRQGGQQNQQAAPPASEFDDDIPFAPLRHTHAI